MSLTDRVRHWVDCFNRADVDGLMDLYDENAINHQVVFEPLVGRDAIRKLFEVEFSRAKMVCIEERIYESGDTAILQWRDPLGMEGCGFFLFKNGKIMHQKGYFDQLTFFKIQGIPIPDQYLG